jgi:hypothetical protein
MALAGRTLKREAPVLQSLACELIFNDCRDAERRHRKADWAKAAHVCCACIRSGWVRSPADNVELNPSDWRDETSMKYLKSNVLKASRGLDKDLGINIRELSTEFRCPHLTNAHGFCERLRLFTCLLEEESANARTPDELPVLVQSSWPCRLALRGSLWRSSCFNGTRLIVACNTYSVRYLPAHVAEDDASGMTYHVPPEDLKMCCSMQLRMEEHELCVAQPTTHEAR